MKGMKVEWWNPCKRPFCYLSGTCCERTWWSSEAEAGSCPDTWPGCPARRRLSRAPSGNSAGPLERSDLRGGEETATLSVCVREPAKRQRRGLTPVRVGGQGLVFVDQSLDLVLPQAREELLVQPGVPLLLIEELGEVLLGHGRLVGAGERRESGEVHNNSQEVHNYSSISDGARWSGGESDSLASEDLIDLWPRAEVCQKHLKGRLCEDVRLHAVVLKYKSKWVRKQVQLPWPSMNTPLSHCDVAKITVEK